jgi:acyl carrier protein
MNNIQKLAAAFKEALGLAADVDVTTLAYGKHKNWDSVAHMQLIAVLEREFDILIETDDVIGMSDYGKAVEILRKNEIRFDA